MSRDLPDAIATEIAKEENKPIHLVELELDSGTVYFTDHDSDVEFAGHTYTAKGLSFSAISTHLSTEVDQVDIEFDNVDRSMSSYLASDEFQGKWLTIKKTFANLLESSENYVILFSGKMKHPRVDESKLIITVVSLLDSLKRTVPARIYQVMCPWEFGGAECGLNITISPYTETGTADAGSTASKLVDSARTEETNYWKYGILEMTSGDNGGLKCEILSSDTGEINLLFAFPNAIAENDSYKITVGCKKTLSECMAYSNEDNFGGFPNVVREVLRK